MDFIELGFVVAKLLRRELRDGFQISDLASVALTPEFQEKLAEALTGISNVPREVEDISKHEAINLGRFVLDKVADFLDDALPVAT